MQQLYQDRNDIQEISQINPPVHAKLTNDTTHLRQDHPAVGIVCPTSFDTSTFNGESKYIHLLRAIAILEKYLQAPPENPDENWGRWKSHATEAINYLKSDAMSNKKVIMICEVQVLLSQYLKARKQMHLLYKEVRADSEKHLAKQFAVAAVDG